MALYREALALDPDQPVALHNLARALLQHEGDFEQSLQMARRAQRLLPEDPRAADTLGWIHCLRDEHDQAVVPLAYAAARLPGNATARFHSAVALYGSGRFGEAKSELDRAIALEPSLTEQPRVKAMLADPRMTAGE